jgi:hypothetical protein
MARSKAQMTVAKRDRERARLEKRARKQEKKEARKLAGSYESTPADDVPDGDEPESPDTPAPPS